MDTSIMEEKQYNQFQKKNKLCGFEVVEILTFRSAITNIYYVSCIAPLFIHI